MRRIDASMSLWPAVAAWLALGFMLLAAAGRTFNAAAQSPPVSAKSGVYTDGQAKRGEDAFRAECVSCHPAMGGSGDGAAPALSGSDFLGRWADRSVGDIFATMRSTMPPNSPASLARETYVDILAYVLKANGYPPGSAELGSGTAMNEIAMGGK